MSPDHDAGPGEADDAETVLRVLLVEDNPGDATMVDDYDGTVTIEDNEPRGTVVDIAPPAALAWDAP
jgi:hypothetical protein